MDVKPYPLMTCAEIREILNRRAVGEQELLEGIEEVDRAPSTITRTATT